MLLYYKGNMVLNKQETCQVQTKMHMDVKVQLVFLGVPKQNKCERPWELAKKEKFENKAEAFKSFCGNQ